MLVLNLDDEPEKSYKVTYHLEKDGLHVLAEVKSDGFFNAHTIYIRFSKSEIPKLAKAIKIEEVI